MCAFRLNTQFMGGFFSHLADVSSKENWTQHLQFTQTPRQVHVGISDVHMYFLSTGSGFQG